VSGEQLFFVVVGVVTHGRVFGAGNGDHHQERTRRRKRGEEGWDTRERVALGVAACCGLGRAAAFLPTVIVVARHLCFR
jgi:hypothetical protein